MPTVNRAFISIVYRPAVFYLIKKPGISRAFCYLDNSPDRHHELFTSFGHLRSEAQKDLHVVNAAVMSRSLPASKIL